MYAYEIEKLYKKSSFEMFDIEKNVEDRIKNKFKASTTCRRNNADTRGS